MLGTPCVLPCGDDWVSREPVPALQRGGAELCACPPPRPRGPPLTPARSAPQGIWRIPVDEIDRPGSFAWHMNRSVVLLLKVLAQLRDHGTLLKVSSMLQRTPDQGK